jgi:Holliday junction resolvase RusA-like endonuclease
VTTPTGIRTYTPKETVAAEKALAQQWVGPPLEGPITLYMNLYDDRIDLVINACDPPTNRKLLRGDIDNYAKLIMDGLNGVAWVDDRQIAYLAVGKM